MIVCHERYTLHLGDCIAVMRTMSDNSMDAIVTDPPYGLEFGSGEAHGWQAGGGFSKPGLGERKTAWPSFSSTSKFGTTNPTCGTCGGRARGKKKCVCIEPCWKPMGKRRNPANVGLPDDATSSGMAVQLLAFEAFNLEWAKEALRILKPGGHMLAFSSSRTYHRLACAIENAGFEIRDQIMFLHGTGYPKGYNLKPAHEPVCLARKPLTGTVASNLARHGTGAINIDTCRIATDPAVDDPRLGGAGNWKTDKAARNVYQGGYAGTAIASSPLGRWPANVIHDGSDDVLERFAACGHPGASRFFYGAKASTADRGDGNNHPTVKSTALMQYLCRLVTPTGGHILDPFLGSGSTGKAAMAEGYQFTGIEKQVDYFSIACGRVSDAYSASAQ